MTAGFCTAILLNGCLEKKEEKIWEQVKIGDLASPTMTGRPASISEQKLKATSLAVDVLQIADSNNNVLDELWQLVRTRPIKFNEQKAFKANQFSAGLVNQEMVARFADFVRKANAQKHMTITRMTTISMLLFDEQPDSFTLALLEKEQDVFYVPSRGPNAGVTVGPGRIALQMTTTKLGGLRGIRNVKIVPVFEPLVGNTFAQFSKTKESDKLKFDDLAFELKISPGDLLIVGPTSHIPNQSTLAALAFIEPALPDLAKTYVIGCTSIND